MATTSQYPVRVDLDAPLEVARWRPLVHWLLVIPHFVVLYVLAAVAGVVTFIAWFAILFTGNIPKGMFDLLATIQRYQWRVLSYSYFMRESYPPFDFTASADDPGNDPARYSIQRPERLSRVLIFFKWLLIIPHLFVLFFLAIAAGIVGFIAWFAVLFTGRWPKGMRDFIVGTLRWSFRVNAYTNLLTDAYPPFSLA